MEVKTWQGGTYGIRVGKKNANDYFDKSWNSIEVKIRGKFYPFHLSKTFWTTCPEFRGVPLPQWLREKKLDDWKEKKRPPYSLELLPIGHNRFELVDPANR